jgi:GNAT superfamily N-acetyltransferase
MAGTLELRTALPSEAQALTELALRSKRAWRYDERFMELVTPHMVVHPEYLLVEHGVVAEESGVTVGCAIARADGKYAFLRDLFVEPERWLRGIGKSLFWEAVHYAPKLGAQELTLGGDPNTIGFYKQVGMRKIGEERSIVGGGRMLPVMSLDIDPQMLSADKSSGDTKVQVPDKMRREVTALRPTSRAIFELLWSGRTIGPVGHRNSDRQRLVRAIIRVIRGSVDRRPLEARAPRSHLVVRSERHNMRTPRSVGAEQVAFFR